MIVLKLLGGASLVSEGAILTGPPAQRHRLALLALVCLHHPQPLSRDKLIGYLWPERDADHARNLLKQSVHVIRKLLGENALLSAGDDLQLGNPPVECDVLAFADALERGDQEQAIACYAGPLLDGFFLRDAPDFEYWLDVERERLHRCWRGALEGVAATTLAEGDAERSVECWRRLLADDPHDARATLGLMEALESVGDRAGAIRQARLHEILLEQDFGAEPDAAVRAMAERIRAGEPDPEAVPAGSGPPAEPAMHDNVAPGRVSVASVDPVAGGSRTRRPARPWPRALAAAAAVLLLATAAWVSVRQFTRPVAEVSRIAVLPLANLTGDPGQEYFVAGMHDALISELARIRALTVISRQSVLRYEGSDLPLSRIAAELGVDAVVEGSAYPSGDSVRINVQLVRVHPEQHLLSATFTHPLDHALALQGEVARAVAVAVRARLRPEVQARMARNRAVDPAAQQAYLSGLYHLERATYGQGLPLNEALAEQRLAIADLERAVALDSTWATAYGKLALAYHWMASGATRADADTYYPKAKAAALRALELDSTEAQAYASLGFVLYQYDWDWVRAEQAIRRAIELEPNSHHWIYALYLSAAGRHDEAIAQYRMAEERDPLSDLLKAQVAYEYQCAGQFEEALAQARQLHARVRASGRTGMVGDSLWLLSVTANLFAMSGMHDSAIAMAERLVAATDTATSGQQLAFALAMAGRRDEALGLLRRIQATLPPDAQVSRAPGIFAALGDTARAVAATEKILRRLGRSPTHVRCWSVIRLLGAAPQVQALLRPMNFPN